MAWSLWGTTRRTYSLNLPKAKPKNHTDATVEHCSCYMDHFEYWTAREYYLSYPPCQAKTCWWTLLESGFLRSSSISFWLAEQSRRCCLLWSLLNLTKAGLRGEVRESTAYMPRFIINLTRAIRRYTNPFATSTPSIIYYPRNSSLNTPSTFLSISFTKIISTYSPCSPTL